jgi:hypothetical protein
VELLNVGRQQRWLAAHAALGAAGASAIGHVPSLLSPAHAHHPPSFTHSTSPGVRWRRRSHPRPPGERVSVSSGGSNGRACSRMASLRALRQHQCIGAMTWQLLLGPVERVCVRARALSRAPAGVRRRLVRCSAATHHPTPFQAFAIVSHTGTPHKNDLITTLAETGDGNSDVCRSCLQVSCTLMCFDSLAFLVSFCGDASDVLQLVLRGQVHMCCATVLCNPCTVLIYVSCLERRDSTGSLHTACCVWQTPATIE